MPRRKAARNCKVLDWLSAKADNAEGRFIQVGNSLLLSKKFGELKPSTQMLYLCMAMEAGGKREFEFPESAALKYHIPPSTLRRSLKELVEKNIIEYSSDERLPGKTIPYKFAVAAFKERPK